MLFSRSFLPTSLPSFDWSPPQLLDRKEREVDLLFTSLPSLFVALPFCPTFLRPILNRYFLPVFQNDSYYAELKDLLTKAPQALYQTCLKSHSSRLKCNEVSEKGKGTNGENGGQWRRKNGKMNEMNKYIKRGRKAQDIGLGIGSRKLTCRSNGKAVKVTTNNFPKLFVWSLRRVRRSNRDKAWWAREQRRQKEVSKRKEGRKMNNNEVSQKLLGIN